MSTQSKIDCITQLEKRANFQQSQNLSDTDAKIYQHDFNTYPQGENHG